MNIVHSDALIKQSPGGRDILDLQLVAIKRRIATGGLESRCKMFGMFNGFGLGGGTFDSNYRAYPVSFIDKGDAEHADKVFLPPSALDRLGM